MKYPSKSSNIQLIILLFFQLSFLLGCGKGFTLKISDQDILAFGAQESCNFITTNIMSNTLRVSWKSSTPATFVITSSVPTQFDDDIESAAAKWNSLIGKKLINVYRDNSFTSSAGNDGTNAIYWLTTWEDENTTQQARTLVRWDVSKIKDADIKINAKNFQYYKTSETPNGKVHLESLLVHEFGHAIGLTHISDTVSVMQIYLKSQVVRNQPGHVDSNSLKCEY